MMQTAPRDGVATRPRLYWSYKTRLAALVAVFVLAWFANLELRGLFIPDEGRYAEIPREMLASGDWVTPRLNDLKYFEKPPLQYWLTAASFSAFGEDEWTARLPAALLGFCAVAIVGLAARRLWSSTAGLIAAGVLGSNWGFYLAGQYLTLDMSVSALLGIALCCFLLAQHDAAGEDERRRWMLAAWTASALAILAKGLVGIVLPGLALLAYSAATRDWRLWRQLHWRAGAALLLAITLPWFLLVQQRNPEFFHFFFIQEHLQRFAEEGHSRPGAWWYYLPILVIGFMPWTPALLRALLQRRPPQPAARFRADWFCAAWALAVVLFFSASHSKLPAYVMPAFPALALFLAGRLQYRVPAALKWCAWTAAAFGALLLAGVARLPQWRKFGELGLDASIALPLLYAAAAMLLVGGLLAAVLVRRSRGGRAAAALAASSFAFWALVFFCMYQLDARFSSERLIEQLSGDRKPFHPELPFYSIGQFDDSVPFYLGRPVTLVGVRGELATGIDAEPQKVVPVIDAFRKEWTALQEQSYAVMTPELYAEFARAGLPMMPVLQDRRLVIVARLPD